MVMGLMCGLAWLGFGCGSTLITANDKNATIIVNGVHVGTGKAKITRRGGPAAIEVRAETPDGRKTRTVIKRRFNPVYSILILWGWAYPHEVSLELPPAPERHGWDSTADPWANAPAGWEPASDEAVNKPAPPPDWNSPENTQSQRDRSESRSPAPAPANRPDNRPDNRSDKPASTSSQGDGGSAWDQPPPRSR